MIKYRVGLTYPNVHKGQLSEAVRYVVNEINQYTFDGDPQYGVDMPITVIRDGNLPNVDKLTLILWIQRNRVGYKITPIFAQKAKEK